MQIAWDQFTPWSALGGGALIGLSAVGLLCLRGRVAGISGMFAGALNTLWRAPGSAAERSSLHCRLAFIAGLLAAPWLSGGLADGPTIRTGLSSGGLIVAGLLVGVGVRLAKGCTSGHGVCGLARGSVRSLVATLCFMGSAFASVFVMRHVLGVAP